MLKKISLCFQIARKLAEVPSPSHFPPVPNVEEMVGPLKQSAGEVEEAARKSPLTQLQMIIEFDKSKSMFDL